MTRPFRTTMLAGLIAAPLIAGGATPTQAQAGFTWHADRTIAANPAQSALSVTYGLPQTDAYQFTARCLFSGGSPQAEVFMAAPVGNLRSGTEVQVQVSGDQGFRQVLNAMVIQQGEGQTGVRFFVAPVSAILTAVRDQRELRYGIPGLPETRLSLRGSCRPMAGFMADCDRIASLRPGGASRPAQGGQAQGTSASFGCERVGRVRSQNSDRAQDVVLVNRTRGFRFVFWLDFNGNPVEYGALNPGESLSISSFLTHPWMITDGPGNCLQVIDLVPGVASYAISAPNRAGGSE